MYRYNYLQALRVMFSHSKGLRSRICFAASGLAHRGKGLMRLGVGKGEEDTTRTRFFVHILVPIAIDGCSSQALLVEKEILSKNAMR